MKPFKPYLKVKEKKKIKRKQTYPKSQVYKGHLSLNTCTPVMTWTLKVVCNTTVQL